MAGIEDVQRAINAEMAESGLTRARMAARMQVDPGTLGDLLDGRRTPKAPTQGKIERYFHWPAGTVAEVLAGRGRLPDAPPTVEVVQGRIDDPADETEASALVSALERQLDEALHEWADAQAELARLRAEIAALANRRVDLAAEIRRLRALYPTIDVVHASPVAEGGATAPENWALAARRGEFDPPEE